MALRWSERSDEGPLKWMTGTNTWMAGMAPTGCMIEVIAMGTRGRQHGLTKYQVKGRKKGRMVEESDRGKFRGRNTKR